MTAADVEVTTDDVKTTAADIDQHAIDDAFF
jgi:hypothetical protein